MANAVSSITKAFRSAMGSKNNAASFLAATSQADQPALNLHMQESSDAIDKSALALEKKLLALEEHAAAEKEFMANAVSSITKAFRSAMGSKNNAASFLAATSQADQPVLNLHMQ